MRTGLPSDLRLVAATAARDAHAEWAARPAGHANAEALAYDAAVRAVKAMVARDGAPKPPPDTSWIRMVEIREGERPRPHLDPEKEEK